MPCTAEQLSDMQCIRDTALRYCRGVDRLDVELMKSAYWEGATDDHGVFLADAWEFCEMCMEAHLPCRSTNHYILKHAIELIYEHHATGEIYNVTYLFKHAEPVLDTWVGRYPDKYEKRGDEWRIIERVCAHEVTHSAPANAMEFETSNFRQGGFDRPSAGRLVGP